MASENLEDLLKRKKKMKEQANIDWQKEKQLWISRINEFYEEIQAFLKPLQEKDLLSFSFEEIQLNEEIIGDYDTKKMIVQFPDQKVVIQPVGRIIIGAKGRMDMIGENGTVKFLLVNKELQRPYYLIKETVSNKVNTQPDPELKWKIATPPPNIEYINLNKDSFSNALLGVLSK
ncbi:hypothetical protein [Siminovitchia sp. 179-K 8D1 HS]|uniref:hypothetical protein n=1 Tax=Siminovitchia sp. 179-K 8D1 HS TaxID=3142385 RepID=UPI0039A30D55